MVLVRAIAANIIPINIAMVSYFSRKVDMSPAVVQSFTCLSSFLTAVCFYFSFGEKLRLQHIVGMFMIVGSVLIVAVAKSMSHNSPQQRNADDDLYLTSVDNEDDAILSVQAGDSYSLMQMLIPYLFAFSTCCFLTISSYASRYTRPAGYPPI